MSLCCKSLPIRSQSCKLIFRSYDEQLVAAHNSLEETIIFVPALSKLVDWIDVGIDHPSDTLRGPQKPTGYLTEAYRSDDEDIDVTMVAFLITSHRSPNECDLDSICPQSFSQDLDEPRCFQDNAVKVCKKGWLRFGRLPLIDVKYSKIPID